MSEARTLVVPFAGERSGLAPLTWGQRAIWHAIGRTAPNDHYFNLGRVLPLADRGPAVPEERFAAAVAGLLARHEALRTRLAGVPGRPGEEQQQLFAAGALEVTVVEEPDPVRARQAARQLLERLSGHRFDYRAEWPVRIGAVAGPEGVSHAVLALCHLASDGHGAEVLLRDLRLLVRRGSAGSPPAATPLDLAREQHGPDGVRRGAAALARWEADYRRMPPTMFAEPVAEPRSPRFWTGRLVSRALARATDAVAAEHRVSGSTVLLAASAALVAADQGHPLAAVMPIAGNRAGRDHRDLVSTLSQDALFVLDLPPEPAAPFTELLPAAWGAALAGYRAAAYHPSDWDGLRERIGRERGTEVHPYCCFNDMRLVERPLGEAVTAGELRALQGRTVVDFPATQELVACRYCLHLTGDGDSLCVTLTADTAYLPPEAIRAHLAALEEVVVASACGTPPRLGELPALLGRAA